MTDASVERIEPDPWLARDFLNRAKEFLGDGASNEAATASRQLLLQNAVITACDAVLAIDGFRVEGVEGGHIRRLEKAQELLHDAPGDLFERLDEVRLTRHGASYWAQVVPAEAVHDAVGTVRELVALAEAYVSPRLPSYLEEPS